jgi:hypothetical protein
MHSRFCAVRGDQENPPRELIQLCGIAVFLEKSKLGEEIFCSRPILFPQTVHRKCRKAVLDSQFAVVSWILKTSHGSSRILTDQNRAGS